MCTQIVKIVPIHNTCFIFRQRPTAKTMRALDARSRDVEAQTRDVYAISSKRDARCAMRDSSARGSRSESGIIVTRIVASSSASRKDKYLGYFSSVEQ